MLKIQMMGLLLSSFAVGSEMVTSEELEAQYGKVPQKTVAKQKELPAVIGYASPLSLISPVHTAATIQKTQAEGEGSLIIGMNGTAPVHVGQSTATDMGMSVVSNQHDIEIDGEKTDILISGRALSSVPGIPFHTDTDIVEMKATNGGIAMGVNAGTIKIVRKK